MPKHTLTEGGGGTPHPADGTPAISRDSPTRVAIAAKNEMSGQKSVTKTEKKCVICEKTFEVDVSNKDRAKYCSPKCTEVYRATREMTRSVAAAEKKIEKTGAFSPAKAAALRAEVSGLVTKHIRMADEVVQGTRIWTPTQARVFSTLLNKVLPDLTAGFVQHEHTVKTAIELTREELERIAAGADDITDVEYTDVDKERAKGRADDGHDA